MENNKMTELELKIEVWLEDEQFVKFANARMNHEIKHVPHSVDPWFDEMEEGFEIDEEYVVPMVEYLSCRMHMAKLCTNRRKREKELWWVWYMLAMQTYFIELLDEYYGALVEELRLEIMPMIHREYVKLQKRKK